MIRLANEKDLDAIEQIYLDIHKAESEGKAVSRALESLTAASQALAIGCTPDIVLTETEAAMSALGELTGRTVRDEVTNRIFERFCVGK